MKPWCEIQNKIQSFSITSLLCERPHTNPNIFVQANCYNVHLIFPRDTQPGRILRGRIQSFFYIKNGVFDSIGALISNVLIPHSSNLHWSLHRILVKVEDPVKLTCLTTECASIKKYSWRYGLKQNGQQDLIFRMKIFCLLEFHAFWGMSIMSF